MKTLLVAVSIVIVGSVSAQDDTEKRQALMLRFADSSTASYILDEKPEVGFADGKLTVTSPTVSTSYDQSAVKEFYFDYVIPTSISSVAEGKFTFVYNDNGIMKISGAKSATATLYTVDGKKVASYAVNDGCVSVPMYRMQTGVYVLKLDNGQSFKVTNK